jgi:hypothetical protein
VLVRYTRPRNIRETVTMRIDARLAVFLARPGNQEKALDFFQNGV